MKSRTRNEKQTSMKNWINKMVQNWTKTVVQMN